MENLDTSVIVFSVVLLSLLFGWFSRMCGGAPPKLPLGLDQFIFSIPYLMFYDVIGIVQSVLSYAGGVLGKRTGHGNGMDLAHVDYEGKPEKVEFLIRWLHDRIPRYWYDFLLLALTSLLANIILGGFLIYTDPLVGAISLFLSTFCKPISYAIGWKIYPNFSGKGLKNLNEATQIGEFLTGFFQCAILCGTWLILKI